MSVAKATELVEHIVLFKFKVNTETSKVNAMVNSLNALHSLSSVLHLTTSPLHLIRTSSSLYFSHILHGRYASRDALSSYSGHPTHVAVVNNLIFHICDDVMAIDWVARDTLVPASPPSGSAIRVGFLKLKEGFGGGVKDEVLRVVKGVRFGGEVVQVSCGENFSPARAKGFTVAVLVVFRGVREMEESVDYEEALVGVREYLDDVIVLDYMVPSLQSSSL